LGKVISVVNGEAGECPEGLPFGAVWCAEHQRRSLGMAVIPDSRKAERLTPERRRTGRTSRTNGRGARRTAKQARPVVLVLVWHHDGDGWGGIVNVERAVSGNQLHKLGSAVVVADVEGDGEMLEASLTYPLKLVTTKGIVQVSRGVTGYPSSTEGVLHCRAKIFCYL